MTVQKKTHARCLPVFPQLLISILPVLYPSLCPRRYMMDRAISRHPWESRYCNSGRDKRRKENVVRIFTLLAPASAVFRLTVFNIKASIKAV
jgi:hypothetical protein